MAFDGLLTGLGNPGQKYAGTRHNFGFDLVDALLERTGPARALGSLGEAMELYDLKFASGPRILVLKPLTFMNLSGRAVVKALNFYKLDPKFLLVAHDELDLPLGQAKFKLGGGAAGHNGISSIIELSGTSDFYRLRLGIGRPEPGREKASYVLSPFSAEERELKAKVIAEAARASEIFFCESAAKAMQELNGLKLAL